MRGLCCPRVPLLVVCRSAGTGAPAPQPGRTADPPRSRMDAGLADLRGRLEWGPFAFPRFTAVPHSNWCGCGAVGSCTTASLAAEMTLSGVATGSVATTFGQCQLALDRSCGPATASAGDGTRSHAQHRSPPGSQPIGAQTAGDASATILRRSSRAKCRRKPSSGPSDRLRPR